MEQRLKLLVSLSALAYLGGLAALFWRPRRRLR
jgi:hypothetical protein